MRDEDRFLVVTGGPGAGKTSLIQALARARYATAPEAGRAVIRMQQAIDGPALPWKDPLLFAELMLAWDMRSHDEARGRPGFHFFDRGISDLIGYLALVGVSVPAHFRRCAETLRYRNEVFILPPWAEIFRNDAERRQDWQEAVATHDAVAAAYKACGYTLTVVPPASLAERCHFVAGRLRD